MNKTCKQWALFAAVLLSIALIYSAIGIAGAAIVIAWAFAYLLFPVRLYFENKGLSPVLATTMVCVMCLLVVGGALGIIIPQLVDEIPKLVDDIPKIAAGVNEYVQKWSQHFGNILGMSPARTHEVLSKQSEDLVQSAGPRMFDNLKSLLVGGTESIFNVLSLSLGPIFFIYFLVNMRSFHASLEKFIPDEPRGRIGRLKSAWHKILRGYVRGLSLVCLFLAAFYGIGLQVSGVKYGLLVGVVAGLLSFIPYLGSIVGFVVSIILLLVFPSSLWNWIGIGITFGVAQFFESYFVTPRLVGKNIGIHPGVVLLLILLGSQLGGVMGMLLAVPLGAMAIQIANELLSAAKPSTPKAQ